MSRKIVLAYSGGLDTTVIIPWLKELYDDAEVIAVCADVGQGSETDGLEERALSTGASKLYIEDLTEEFVTDVIFPTIKANAVYEGKYLLGTSMARPIIAKRLVEIARKEGAFAICHGATGKGNDQVRFELTVKAFAPDIKIIAPWKMDEWTMRSREDEIAYLEERNIPVPMKKDDSYSRDRNLWHISHEGLELEDPANEPNFEHLLQLGVSPEKAPDKDTYVEIEFEKGIPVAIDGEKLAPVALIEKLNKLGGENGIGICDIVENRVVGMKSRGVYETPGGTILMYAHRELEYLTLDRQSQNFREEISKKYADILYDGTWYTPLREALDAFNDKIQETVTGKVRLKLYKGNIISAGSSSPYSLYNEDIASFSTGELYSHKDAVGFINLFGLPMTVRALMKENNKQKENNK
ncbi:MAG: argininosuccinate synthase [Firmicutes bacterium]|jgi:argininosuccinate synthase|nr:argininosuccinate synthase [Bacillota bacterium]